MVVAGLPLVFSILLDDHFGQFVVGDEIPHADEFVEDVDGEGVLLVVAVIEGLSSGPLALFDQVEQL